jgi:DNA-binding transcriptional regulator PaaX
MSSKSDHSKKIIKILAEKPAVAIADINKHLTPNPSPYKGLEEAGFIENISSGQGYFARLTKEGKKKAMSIKLESEDSLVSTTWDGYWRVILLDLPESRKSERESLRYLLKKAGFVCLKNSAWISPYPFEHLFTNIKKDLGLSTELMILVTKNVDEVTESSLFSLFGFNK